MENKVLFNSYNISVNKYPQIIPLQDLDIPSEIQYLYSRTQTEKITGLTSQTQSKEKLQEYVKKIKKELIKRYGRIGVNYYDINKSPSRKIKRDERTREYYEKNRDELLEKSRKNYKKLYKKNRD